MINILTAANGLYVKYLTVMLVSTFLNNDDDISVYVLTEGFTREEYNLLEESVKFGKGKRKIITLPVNVKALADVNTKEFSVETYFRLLMLMKVRDVGLHLFY